MHANFLNRGLICIAAVLAAPLLVVACSDAALEPKRSEAKLKAAKLLIEHNAGDEDTGFQGFADHDPWNELAIEGPKDELIATVTAGGGLRDFGLTELFFETSEPPNDEVPMERVLERLPKGKYEFEASVVGGGEAEGDARFTHDIPAGVELLTPEEEAEGLDPSAIVVAWVPVARTLAGNSAKIVGYQVIVEEVVEPPQFPQTFAEPVFSVHVPASASAVSVSPEFMLDDACWEYEVLAIEDSGNQTISSGEFTTGEGCAEEPEEPEGDPAMTQAKLLIEHNATDEDTGFQGFADGDPWNELTITGPGGVEIVRAMPGGGLFDFGLTELFFETSEPENAVVPISEVLAHLPAGDYTFRGIMVGGGISRVTATLTHAIPAGPELLTPADGAEDVDPEHTVVSWQPVVADLGGDPVTIVGYQVIVEEDVEVFSNTFAQPAFSVYLPATSTSVSVPPQFMRSDADYEYEVLAIEASGNQTLSSAEFSTR